MPPSTQGSVTMESGRRERRVTHPPLQIRPMDAVRIAPGPPVGIDSATVLRIVKAVLPIAANALPRLPAEMELQSLERIVMIETGKIRMTVEITAACPDVVMRFAAVLKIAPCVSQIAANVLRRL